MLAGKGMSIWETLEKRGFPVQRNETDGQHSDCRQGTGVRREEKKGK